MTDTVTEVDIAIIGGGIAGLWLLNRLSNDGYHTVLFEQDTLGGGQSIASQGMIHGGIKYALSGALTGASEAIADMPDHWRRCLKGEGDVDLSKASVLSDHFYMWSTQSLTSKVTSFFASKIARGRVDAVNKKQRPPVFQSEAFKGNLYKLVDLVLDTPSVIKALSDNYSEQIFSIDWQQAIFQRDDSGAISQLRINDSTRLKAKHYIFAAGEGNGALLNGLSLQQPAMQVRPVHQVLVKHDYPHSLYAHCMGSNPSPRLTVSSHRCDDGKWVWYLGGDLATEGIHLSKADLIEKAQTELAELFSWIDFGKTEWETLYINRAEPKQKSLIKPDKAFAETAPGCTNLIVCWPTKLTLAPNTADEVTALLKQQVQPSTANRSLDTLQHLNKPAVGTPCWDTLFKQQKL